ncbi:hypothetical protein CPB84DRAFT_1372815 [Gymnopilus junonius]|uniref:Uncharacterized protein n=1 Tax=Gymnopilus junonius TaxID=109634 RepID=A0A9P5NLS9_GYMJU|nr:hypothetical protein CPB84DRAFT_1372815 [Gymnopilus junonius]
MTDGYDDVTTTLMLLQLEELVSDVTRLRCELAYQCHRRIFCTSENLEVPHSPSQCSSAHEGVLHAPTSTKFALILSIVCSVPSTSLLFLHLLGLHLHLPRSSPLPSASTAIETSLHLHKIQERLLIRSIVCVRIAGHWSLVSLMFDSGPLGVGGGDARRDM